MQVPVEVMDRVFPESRVYVESVLADCKTLEDLVNHRISLSRKMGLKVPGSPEYRELWLAEQSIHEIEGYVLGSCGVGASQPH
ncbi:hypothetical protein [Pseudomonas phage PH826]|nr:hypothetical protein [Pseudomonas phage PH826]